MRRSEVGSLQIRKPDGMGVAVTIAIREKDLDQCRSRFDKKWLPIGAAKRGSIIGRYVVLPPFVDVKKPTPPEISGVFCVVPYLTEQNKTRARAIRLIVRTLFRKEKLSIDRCIALH